MNEVVEALPLPRPLGVPAHVPDSLLLDCVRDFLLGEKDAVVALKLGITVQGLYHVIRTSAWRLLQNNFRDEFLATSGSRLLRLENKLIDKIESFIDDGIECHGQTRDGETYSYTRQLSPKESVSIALMLNDTNKRLDRLREGDVDRKRFDAATWVAKLTKAAQVARDKEIDGQAVRVG